MNSTIPYHVNPGLSLSQISPKYPNDICLVDISSYTCPDKSHQITFLRISPTGQIMIAIRLTGQVHLWTRRLENNIDVNNPNLFQPQSELLLNLPLNLGTTSHGLTGLILSFDFNESSMELQRRYVFLTYNTIDQQLDKWVGRIVRFTLEFSAITQIWSADNLITIYENSEDYMSIISDHTLHGGIATSNHHLIVGIGDANRAQETAHNPLTDMGKILIMTYDGGSIFNITSSNNETTSATPFPNPLHLANGNRNLYSLDRLPISIDKNRRFAWGDIGNDLERLVLYSLLPKSDDKLPNYPHDLQWSGTDNQAWIQMHDPITGSAAVLHSETDSVSIILKFFNGTERVFQDRNTLLPRNYPLQGEGVYVRTFAGYRSGIFVKSVNLFLMVNLQGVQPASLFYYELVHAIPDVIPSQTTPFAVDIDPITGSVIFGDLFTGNVYQIDFLPSNINVEPQPLRKHICDQKNWREIAFVPLVVGASIFLFFCLVFAFLFYLYFRKYNNNRLGIQAKKFYQRQQIWRNYRQQLPLL